MAKRRMRLSGLGDISRPGSLGRDVMPGAIGLLLAGGTTLAVRSFVRPLDMPGLYRWAPALGAGIGALGAVGVNMVAGRGPAISTAAHAVLGAAFLSLNDMVNASRPGAAEALAAGGSMLPGSSPEPETTPTEGLRALVAERQQGLGTIVMEPVDGMRGAYGETVNLAGTINQGAFGKQSFLG